MNKSLNIDIAAYDAISDIKTNHSFKSFSDCIFTMTVFFKNNNISPRDSINNNFSTFLVEMKIDILKEIVDFKKFVKDDSQSFRKMQKAIEKDQLISLNRKVDEIYKKTIEDKIEESNNKLENKIISDLDNDLSKDNIIKKNIEIIESKNKTIKQMEKIIDEQDKTLKEYYSSLRILNENMGVDRGITGNKIIINLPLDEVNLLFKMIP